MNTILTSLARLNELPTIKPATLKEKLDLIREESALLADLEDAGRPAFYSHTSGRYELVVKTICGMCAREPWVCLLETGTAICPLCADLLLRIQKDRN